MVKDSKIRVMISMDKDLYKACNKLITKMKESGFKEISNMSKLVEKAICEYISDLHAISNLTLMKGEKDNAN